MSSLKICNPGKIWAQCQKLHKTQLVSSWLPRTPSIVMIGVQSYAFRISSVQSIFLARSPTAVRRGRRQRGPGARWYGIILRGWFGFYYHRNIGPLHTAVRHVSSSQWIPPEKKIQIRLQRIRICLKKNVGITVQSKTFKWNAIKYYSYPWSMLCMAICWANKCWLCCSVKYGVEPTRELLSPGSTGNWS
jgi:hypothetical protein